MLTVDSFLRKFEELKTDAFNSSYLLAVSGGIDSMVLLHLFNKADFQFEVAHCNFNLRGEESDKDEQLVRSFCESEGIKVHVKSFNTKSYAVEKGISIQIAARELRYSWFREITTVSTWIVMAHHLDDAIESSMFNFLKGTGIRGLKGMPENSNGVIRPLLSFTRSEIEEYAKKNNISWREDISNDDTVYHRNYLRHRVIPHFKTINKNYRKTWTNSREKWIATESLLQSAISKIKKYNSSDTNSFTVGVDDIVMYGEDAAKLVIYELLRDIGIDWGGAGEIWNSLKNNSTGNFFKFKKHEILVDRGNLLVRLKKSSKKHNLELNRTDTEVDFEEYHFTVTLLSKNKWGLIKDDNIGQFDEDKLTYPLILRSWKQGDKIVPLGMKGRKKVSDILIDKKVNRMEKRDVTVLESGGEVIWVPGYKMNEKFKVTEETKSVKMIKRWR